VAAVAREAVRAVLVSLIGQEPKLLVLWPHDRTLFTSDEFLRFLAPCRVGPAPAEPEPVARPAFDILDEDDLAAATRQEPRARPADALAPANDMPDLPRPRCEELARVRAALYPEFEAERCAGPTLAHRISAVSMDMTLLIVALPVGAAVVTHNVLRGRTDLRLSARMMALTGALLAMTDMRFLGPIFGGV
jgi:hypothetical protein